MFSGKSTALIQRLQAAAAGLPPGRVRAFKPASDTRYAPGAIVTHPGASLPAQALTDPAALPGLADEAQVVGIDEAHFFGAAIVGPVRTLVDRGVHVLVAGVERDHRGAPFDPFPALLIEADEVVKLLSVCARCGQPAVHSQRLFDSSERVAVGGPGDYEARCRRCFQPPA